MRILLTSAAALFATAAMAIATSASADECGNAAGGQAGLNECYDKAFKKSDAELNKLYKDIENRLKSDPDTTKLLVGAQRRWVAFRDAECEFQASASSGGSVGPMIYSMCLDGLTKRRIEDFKGYLQCAEGDLSCPVPAAN
ncbi:MAG TPA: lysozyme inhibitor LprI family protein [Rhizobiaceae bacterium]|nr:lysozyme inhibitor LprI family protein [Rhizobiaceae bacterium]